MATKRVDPLKAKAAKQKKIAIGGMVLLVALLAVQGPKTLKMLKGPQPVAPTAETAPAPASGTPAPGTPAPAPATGTAPTGGTVAGEASATAAAAELASVPNSDQAPVVDDGQLASFERFASKDPFAQQAEPVTAPNTATKDTATKEPGKSEPAADPVDASKPTQGNGSSVGSPDGGFTVGGSKPEASPVLAAATSVAVNGVAENVAPDVPFPAAEPIFVLVSVSAKGTSVEIGIAGGEYAGGGKTLELALGKKITLQNTADGSRFELELLSIQGFPLPKQKLPK